MYGFSSMNVGIAISFRCVIDFGFQISAVGSVAFLISSTFGMRFRHVVDSDTSRVQDRRAPLRGARGGDSLRRKGPIRKTGSVPELFFRTKIRKTELFFRTKVQRKENSDFWVKI